MPIKLYYCVSSWILLHFYYNAWGPWYIKLACGPSDCMFPVLLALCLAYMAVIRYYLQLFFISLFLTGCDEHFLFMFYHSLPFFPPKSNGSWCDDSSTNSTVSSVDIMKKAAVVEKKLQYYIKPYAEQQLTTETWSSDVLGNLILNGSKILFSGVLILIWRSNRDTSLKVQMNEIPW